MKKTLTLLVMFAFSISHPHAESFSSSSNFIQTLTIGTNEAIFITTLKYTHAEVSELSATILRSNQTTVLPITAQAWGDEYNKCKTKAFAGPMNIQFHDANVLMEFQRIQTTNVFTTIFNASNGIAINVPSGKTISFLTAFSWFHLNGVDNSFPTALITLSNSTTVVKDFLYGADSFSGPLTITLVAGSTIGNTFHQGWVTYYFTEEFVTLPNIGATFVPAGKSVLTIEKSQDLTHWGTVFFQPVGSDKSGFYRFNFSK